MKRLDLDRRPWTTSVPDGRKSLRGQAESPAGATRQLSQEVRSALRTVTSNFRRIVARLQALSAPLEPERVPALVLDEPGPAPFPAFARRK
jgi:hypothetical protein